MKKTIYTKFMSVVLAAVLLLALAVPAMAADSVFVIENGYLWNYTGPGGDVVIPDSVTEIGDYAFSSKHGAKVTSITIPGSVTKIGNHAFENCSSLTSITVPSSVTKIGNNAFRNCSNLTSVVISYGVKEMSYEVFYGCSSLTNVIIPSSLTKIESSVFMGCSSLASVTIPSSLTEIGINMFYNCSSLASVTIPSSITKINMYAFYGCNSLTSIDIPYGVEEIGSDAFFDCSSLTSVTIPSSVTKIGGAAFSGCYSLTSITIPASVTELGSGTFNGCAYMTDIYFGGTPGQWESYNFHSYFTFLDPEFVPTIHYNSTGPQQTTPTPTPSTTTSFSDVSANVYYAQPVSWAIEKGITNGTGDGKFSPDKTCNTAEILTFLWRACGSPKVEAAGGFSDVAANAWYADAANWAKAQGMISGSTLSPNTPCTRASTVMFIWQAAGKPGASKAASFTDVPANAGYAAAVAWAVENGVTTGTGTNTFSPDATCTRGQIVTFLYRAVAK